MDCTKDKYEDGSIHTGHTSSPTIYCNLFLSIIYQNVIGDNAQHVYWSWVFRQHHLTCIKIPDSKSRPLYHISFYLQEKFRHMQCILRMSGYFGNILQICLQTPEMTNVGVCLPKNAVASVLLCQHCFCKGYIQNILGKMKINL